MPAAIVLAGLLAASAGTAVALAAAPIKGATYQGKLKLPHATSVTFPISFKVSANGKRVSNFTLAHGYPVYCQGGGFGQQQPASGTVTSKGKFTVKLPIFFAPAHQHQGFVIVTGTFAKNGRESGTVVTDFTRAHVCNGTSTYTTTG
jgi:hypothetical protein